MARSKLRRSAPGVSFFAFQDIITATTGILTLIALMLALDITKTASSAPEVDPALKTRLEELQEEWDGLRPMLANVPAASDAATKEHKIANTKVLIEALKKDTAEADRLAAALGVATGENEKVEALTRKHERTTHELEAATASTGALQSELNQISAKVKERESAQLNLDRSGKFWFIPELSRTGKTALIVSVLPDVFVLSSMDSGQQSRANRSADPKADLESLLQPFNRLTHYAVLFFRPSTVASFDVVKKAVDSLGFEIGYDFVDEETEVVFAPPELTSERSR